ncbi:MAG: SDR family oxidoreductase [Proteobacteria bacterium]|jgi:3-oxoacyl-[acyl-carrier protein] reductase|nr:SDR family oxidoreductase [Pseudomonadota bacterium]
MKLLEGKIAIVTGATKAKGLGKAIAVKLAEQGAKVALTGRTSSKEGVEANVAEIKASGGEAMAILVDVSDSAQVDAAIQQVADAWGQVDILINNAGVGFGSAVLTENQDRDWDGNYAVNVKGTMELCRGVIPYMEKSGGGSIVNVSSLAGTAVSFGMPYPYVATKHALVGATKVLALEVAGKGIRANVVAPGAINTDMLQQAYAAIAEAEGISVEEAGRKENASIPLGRPAEPSEIAAAVVFLAGPDASFITGIALPVAGGMAPGI